MFDFLDIGVIHIYKKDTLTAMGWFKKIWNAISEATVRSCWRTTVTVSAYDCVEALQVSDDAERDEEALENYAQVAIPTASRRISMSELLDWGAEIDCAHVYLDKHIIANILSAGSEELDA